MAPEQFFSKRKIVQEPEKSDVFSAGVMMFHLLFKKHPFLPNSVEDKACNSKTFVRDFINSPKNEFKVKISEDLEELLQGMLTF